MSECDKGRRSGFSGEKIVESEDFVFFWKPPAVFSQWTPSKFTVDGTTYCCAEQYMMAKKARLFADHVALRNILATKHPGEHQRLGRTVAKFDQKEWDRERFAIVVKANLEKFRQNSEMRSVLLATRGKTLVEASPVDKVWGIGLRADDIYVMNRSKWRGENLLGKALMQVRETLLLG